MKLLTITIPDDVYDGYWYCPTAIYPRFDGRPAPEEGCTETEPVFVSDDGLTATGTTSGVYRPVPAVALPPTGGEPTLLVVAVVLVAVGGWLCRLGRSG